MKIILSNGSYKFHLAPLAVELNKLGILVGFITAGWPRGWQKWLAERFPDSLAWKRLLDRREDIPDGIVTSVGITELFFKIGDRVIRPWSKNGQQRIHKLGFMIYSKKANKVLKRLQPDIYHYRNCYGLGSIENAKSLGAIALCDHSIAHPICLQWMEKNDGKWPPKLEISAISANLTPLYKYMEEDLKKADHILVNSQFVKDTCVYVGIPEQIIHVIYLGVDEGFFNQLKRLPQKDRKTASSILFAGGWQKRKGVDTLVKALQGLDEDWELDIAGGLEAGIRETPTMTDFFSRSNVTYKGILPREELAALMKVHNIFVFPSFSEGSARVIFEAMASGCYVITTKNSGSIVVDGIHGAVVEAGDEIALRNALTYAIQNPDWVREVGRNNAELVKSKYRQRDYGNNVYELYKLLSSN